GCWLHSPSEVTDRERVMSLSVVDLAKFSPEELALPQFRNSGDLNLLTLATEKLGRFADHADWTYTPRLMFSSSDAAFQPIASEIVGRAKSNHHNRRLMPNNKHLLPVYEGKMVGLWDHRQADIRINPNNPARQAQEVEVSDSEKEDPNRFAIPQFWL